MKWNQYDIYSKGVDGINVKTMGGGIISLGCIFIIITLLCAETYSFISTKIVHRMYVDALPVR